MDLKSLYLCSTMAEAVTGKGYNLKTINVAGVLVLRKSNISLCLLAGGLWGTSQGTKWRHTGNDQFQEGHGPLYSVSIQGIMTQACTIYCRDPSAVTGWCSYCRQIEVN